jgi:hypothetical protein
MADKCRSCGAAIEWAVTERGKRMPVDAEPVEDGTILLSHKVMGEPPVATVQSKAQIEQARSEAAHLGQPHRLFKSHFATCPQSNRWRKLKETTE